MSILSTLNQKIIFFDSSMTIDDIKDFSLDETIFFSFEEKLRDMGEKI